tara:strand:- start:32 stop:793 length:762 start_codon:yes stop_codon:yes gene_type:complete
MTRILVTGHNGFIGSHVFNDLRHEQGYGYLVDGLDRPYDIGEWVGPSGMFAKHYDYVIHLAAYAALRDSIDDPERFWENNVEKSKPIFDYCRENNVRLLYASSAGAHEWWQNPYAITKKANELMAPPNSVGMRFFNVWSEEGSRSDMLYRMLQDKTATYLTRHKRDWIHVKDVVRAIAYLMTSEYTGTIDIGTGESVSVLDLAKHMGVDNLPIKMDTPNEPDELCADTTKLRGLGWFPTVKILDKKADVCYNK